MTPPLPPPPPRWAPQPQRSRAVLLSAIVVAAIAAAVLTVLAALLVRQLAPVAITPSPSPVATTPPASPSAPASSPPDAVVLGGPYTAGRLLIGDVVVLPDERGEVEVRATVSNPGAAVEAVVLEVTLLVDGEAFATAATAPLDLAAGVTDAPIVFLTFDAHRPDVDEARFRQL